jgi:hypothetical protein
MTIDGCSQRVEKFVKICGSLASCERQKEKMCHSGCCVSVYMITTVCAFVSDFFLWGWGWFNAFVQGFNRSDVGNHPRSSYQMIMHTMKIIRRRGGKHQDLSASLLVYQKKFIFQKPLRKKDT